MIKAFDPKTDRDILRAVLKQLAQHEGLGDTRLIRELEKKYGTTSENEVIARSTLQNFKNQTGGLRYPRQLANIWNYLASKEDYQKYFPKECHDPDNSAGVLRAEVGLSEAIQTFLADDAIDHQPIERIKTSFPGQYVMYRADLRPYRYSQNPAKRFRASAIDIALVHGSIVITETQDYPALEDERPFYLKASGIMYPYGRYIMFMMRAVKAESFRLGVIDQIFPFLAGQFVESFSGTILVASQLDLFPSTSFFCKRNDGNLRTGILNLDDIPIKEAQDYLHDGHLKAAFYYTRLHPTLGRSRYINTIINSMADKNARSTLNLNYRQLKVRFNEEKDVKAINDKLNAGNELTRKSLKIVADIAPTNSWDSNLALAVDDVSFAHIGKGEQNQIQIKIAIENRAKDVDIVMLEEPENHLSHINLVQLVSYIEKRNAGKPITSAKPKD